MTGRKEGLTTARYGPNIISKYPGAPKPRCLNCTQDLQDGQQFYCSLACKDAPPNPPRVFGVATTAVIRDCMQDEARKGRHHILPSHLRDYGGSRVVPLAIERKNFIGQARQAAGLTQTQLAKKTGLSQSSVSQIENPSRQPRLDTLRRIAGALGCDVSFLIDGAPAAESPRPNGDLPKPGAPETPADPA